MKTTPELLLSRNFVEFGPFTAEELLAFAGRGILQEADFVKGPVSHAWQPCMEWLAGLETPVSGESEAKPAKGPVKKRASKPKLVG